MAAQDTTISLLVVDDREDTAPALAQILADADFRPAYAQAGGPVDLARCLADEAWDVVVCRLDMPGLPWNEVAGLVRASGRKAPVVVLAPDADRAAEVAVDCMRSGARDVVAEGDWRFPGVAAGILREARELRQMTRVEQDLRHAEKRYRRMIDDSVKGLFRCTPWGEMTTANPALASILGWDTPGQMLAAMKGREREFFDHPGDMDDLLAQVREKESVEDEEVRILRRDGSPAWISISARAVRAPSGELSAVEGSAEDVTRRKSVESRIVRAKKEWERTFDSVRDLVVILDPDLRIRRLNTALADRIGVHPREVVGRTCMAVFDLRGGPPDVCARIMKMADGGDHAEEMDIPALGGHFLVTLSPFFIDEDERAGTVLVAHDITRRKDLEAELRRAQKMEAIGTLAGGIAHDFNNILGVIMGYAEMASEDAEPEGVQARRLGEVMRAGRRARDLVHQILTFSRHGEHDLRPLRLTPVIKETAKLLAPSLPPGVEPVLDLVPDRDTVDANLTQMHQVLMNLCSNAAMAMAETGGALTVALNDAEEGGPPPPPGLPDAPGGWLRLSVSDTGPGVPPDIRDQIFDPFFTTRSPGKGTGMGLALVHGIAKGHGGAVTVGDAPGGGAVFHVFLPRSTGAPTPGPDLEPPAQRGRGKVLVVDDESALGQMTVEMLSGLGYEAGFATSGEKALELFEADPQGFDLVLADLIMPGMSGDRLAAELLKRRPGLPVVLCTGFSESASMDAARELGISEIMLKPVLKRDLAETLARALARTLH